MFIHLASFCSIQCLLRLFSNFVNFYFSGEMAESVIWWFVVERDDCTLQFFQRIIGATQYHAMSFPSSFPIAADTRQEIIFLHLRRPFTGRKVLVEAYKRAQR